MRIFCDEEITQQPIPIGVSTAMLRFHHAFLPLFLEICDGMEPYIKIKGGDVLLKKVTTHSCQQPCNKVSFDIHDEEIMFYFGVLMMIESNLFSFFISLKGYVFNQKRAQCFIATVLLFIGA